MGHVFVSYCHEDADFSHLLEAGISQSEFRTWRDQALSAGDDWRAEIDVAIREALAVVVILSPVSIRSAYVNYEWAFALGSAIPVVPVGLRVAQDDLHPRLRTLPYFDFSDGAARPLTLLIESLRGIEDALRPNTVHVPRDAPPVIHQAARGLDSMDAGERQAAIDSLGQMNDPVIGEVLAEAARHPVRQVRVGAAIHLAARQDPRAIPALLEGIRLQDERVAPWMLGKIGPAAAPALVEALRDQDGRVRHDVCTALGVAGGSEAVGALVEFLRDPDAENRSSAAYALGLAADLAAIPALVGLAHDPARSVRTEVLRALVKCAAEAGASQEVFRVFLEALDDEHDQVAIAASEGLQQSGDARAVPGLVRAALTSEREQVRSFSKSALRSFGTAPAPALREAALSPDSSVRARAIGFLGEMRDESDLALLISATRDQDPNVRRRAVYALEDPYAKPAVPALIERLQDEDVKVVHSAVISLGRIGDPGSVPALIECLKDDELADAAASALEHIGVKEARAAVKAWNRQKVK